MSRFSMICLVSMLFCLLSVPVIAVSEKNNSSKITVHREGGRVWLEGVKGWSVGQKESSVHAAQEAIVCALGDNISYDYLVGVSGLAFRMQVYKDSMCPSSPHPCCGFECTERSSQAVPWNTKGLGVKADEPASVAEVRKAVVESIDKGIPVRYATEEEGVVVGYQKNGEEWICLHPFKNDGNKTFVESKVPWGVCFYTEHKQNMPSKRDLVTESLRQAVKMAETPESNGYWLGLKAWDVYIDRLTALDKADDKVCADAMLGNAWIYECLTNYRLSAARYLRSVTGDFSPEVSGHLLKAADLYDKMATQVLTDKDHCPLSVAPFPWMLKKGDKWTSEARDEQIKRLKKALPLERQALREISKALSYSSQ